MNDQARLAQSEAQPPLIRLHRALGRLSSVLTVMNTGAHPDDEQSGMLAWLRFGEGMRIVIACSTRGEGGQNILGPERGGLLGVLRTRELEEAARVLDCDIAWLGHGPDDPVYDFGFSKDGDQTLARWDEALIVARLSEAYRRWRPDVVIPTFLDVPGQHGHHRAMTRAAEAAISLAAQAAPDDTLPGWQVSRFYLPAWSGAGGTYDDTEPPPPATLRLAASGTDPATGASFGEIGEWSRRRHASQGMGHWPGDPNSGWSLHWRAGGDETMLAEGIPRDLAKLARIAGPAEVALAEAAGAVTTAIAAFPDSRACLAALAEARIAVEAAERASDQDFQQLHGHRLTRKRREIDAAMAEAAGLRIWAEPRSKRIVPGGKGAINICVSGPVSSLDIRPILPTGSTAAPVVLQAPGKATIPISTASDTAGSAQFVLGHDALGGNDGGYIAVTAEIAGIKVALTCDLEPPVCLRPTAGPTLTPETVLMTGDPLPLALTLSGASDGLTLDLPAGWSSVREREGFLLTPPHTLPEGLSRIPAIRKGRPALAEETGEYPHVGAFSFARPAVLRVLRLDLAMPEGARVAYVRGTDDTGPWLKRMGIDVTVLDAIEPDQDFSAYTTVLAGVVAFGARPDLTNAIPALHRFVEAGGNLVTLYQRPDQGWNDATTPPRPLTVGTPSVRWRVTDPDAPVTILDPSHPLLTFPNIITGADFTGWHKERGLYFASRWDPSYTPLIALSDPGETLLKGSLLSGRIERGRHTHCALNLHHQLEQLVPGAFRLLANLLQPAS